MDTNDGYNTTVGEANAYETESGKAKLIEPKYITKRTVHRRNRRRRRRHNVKESRKRKTKKTPVASKTTAPAKTEDQKKEETKPQNQSRRPKLKKKPKKEEKGIYAIYKIEGDKVARLRPTCRAMRARIFHGRPS